MAYQILLDGVLIVVTLFLLDRREARWAPRAARRDRSHLRPVPHSLRATPASERRKAS